MRSDGTFHCHNNAEPGMGVVSYNGQTLDVKCSECSQQRGDAAMRQLLLSPGLGDQLANDRHHLPLVARFLVHNKLNHAHPLVAGVLQSYMTDTPAREEMGIVRNYLSGIPTSATGEGLQLQATDTVPRAFFITEFKMLLYAMGTVAFGLPEDLCTTDGRDVSITDGSTTFMMAQAATFAVLDANILMASYYDATAPHNVRAYIAFRFEWCGFDVGKFLHVATAFHSGARFLCPLYLRDALAIMRHFVRFSPLATAEDVARFYQVSWPLPSNFAHLHEPQETMEATRTTALGIAREFASASTPMSTRWREVIDQFEGDVKATATTTGSRFPCLLGPELARARFALHAPQYFALPPPTGTGADPGHAWDSELALEVRVASGDTRDLSPLAQIVQANNNRAYPTCSALDMPVSLACYLATAGQDTILPLAAARFCSGCAAAGGVTRRSMNSWAEVNDL
jgi:hypothetical protein